MTLANLILVIIRANRLLMRATDDDMQFQTMARSYYWLIPHALSSKREFVEMSSVV